ncbi:diguanylate cyclase domain-containing protein [Clostridium psychrophilum]|uniref:diguanylate cyclase domain-containing protein n=1 Tax=Clostridium psychrophilum TaxID=132926 RepID=UPI001C0B119C|nr:diguanylate cyclase [Clostridium psychrophilum]MBU3181991.1 diguanylate cyclase [Clostridium psychrophilum]
MLQEDNIKILLFTILCICFIFYLFLGIYSYKRDKKSKINVTFLILCISASIWAMGYALMLISSNIKIANLWRIFAAIGWCFFNGIWISFIFSLNNASQKKFTLKIQSIVYISATIFFISNLIGDPSKIVSNESYGFVDNLYINTAIGNVFSIYIAILFISGIVMIYFQIKNTKKNRVRKQMKIIFITSLITFCLSATIDLIFPILGISVFPSAIIIMSISMGGIWHAINKHKMMSISYELVSEYIFEAVNEPIFILGEDFIVKNCNEAALNITGYSRKDLDQNPFDTIMDYRDFKFDTIMQEGFIINIEIDLFRKNKEALICELSATVIYDEYKDVLGILILLHDVSGRKKIAEIQRIYTFKLEESVYYDSLTKLFNRKKMRKDVDILLVNKNEKFAFLFIDLDKFKSVNDNYGHLAGDSILKTVAIRLKSIVRSTDTVYRIGGDEFIIVLKNLKEIANAEKIAIAVLKILTFAFTYNENQLFVGACIGISIFPEHGIDEDTLSKKADLAMYEVKRKGGNGYKIYSLKLKEEDLDPNDINEHPTKNLLN